MKSLADDIGGSIPTGRKLNTAVSREVNNFVNVDGGRFNDDGTGFWNGFTEIGRLIATHVDEESS